MPAALAKLWNDVLASYWFIPGLMAIAALVLALVLTEIDEAVGSQWFADINWLFAYRSDGARALLATIAGSMITVAGVTFSVTISAVAYTTSQFGPRLLTNFMQDRSNQVTLGTFIATFIYCLLVLRTVRSTNDCADCAFVPQLAMVGALLLALASVAVLIYFIHHVPASIHISNVAAKIAVELNQQIVRLCPEPYTANAEVAGQVEVIDDELQLKQRYQSATAVSAEQTGYLQHLNGSGLFELAKAHELQLFVVVRPGQFVLKRRPLLYVWPPISLTQAVAEKIHGCFAYGNQRTQAQDMMFLVQELVEIAARALSPGINDPFTAINCMNWLGSGLANFALRQPPAVKRYDTSGKLRVMFNSVTFKQFADVVFNRLRPYVIADRNAALALLQLIAEVAPDVVLTADREHLKHHVELLCDGTTANLDQQQDRDVLTQHFQKTLAIINDPSGVRPPNWRDDFA